MTRIVKNVIKCKKCGDVIESTSRHDFKYCKCGAVAVDGGHDYLRRCGDIDGYEDLSVIKEVNENDWERIFRKNERMGWSSRLG